MPAVEVSNLCKSYLSTKKAPGVAGALKALVSRETTTLEAVKDLTFSIEEGEVVGFLGPNGAGKTTTLKMLCGILFPTSGEILTLGFRPFDRKHELLRQISLVMGNRQQLWWDLPAWDSFLVLKELFEVSEVDFKRRTEELIEALDLGSKVNTQVRKLSLGERMKCEFIAALLHSPRLIYLDEPTLGLDVVSQKRIRDFLRTFHKQNGCTIILTSHYMQDIQELCERVIVIDHGSLVYQGTLESLTFTYSESKRLRLTFETSSSYDLSAYGSEVETTENTTVIAVPRNEVATATARILKDLPVIDIAIEDVSTEEVIRDLFANR